MRVLDANFLIDYLNGVSAAKAYYEENGGQAEHWIVPAPVHAEVLVGVGNSPTGDADRAIEALSWCEVYDVGEELTILGARIADEIGWQGPYLDGVDALVTAVGRTLGAPIVSADSDLTLQEIARAVDVEEYR